LVDSDEILYEDNIVDSDSYSVLYRLVECTIRKWRTFKVLSCVQMLNPWFDLVEVEYEGVNIDSDIDSMLFRIVDSTIPKFQSFKLLRCVQLFHRLVN
jgi:hypothetical protein